jgi:hypothetical protein
MGRGGGARSLQNAGMIRPVQSLDTVFRDLRELLPKDYGRQRRDKGVA